MNCFVCFTSDDMTYFTLGILEEIHCHVPQDFGHIIDGIVQIHECQEYFWGKKLEDVAINPKPPFMNSSWMKMTIIS
jgi:hypothetical protein